jgi:hypothetical protein
MAAAHTIEAKRAFERYAKVHGVLIKHYHADNAIFDSKEFVAEVHASRQTISYCAVNAHHQNGKAEKRIRDLQDAARTMMLHAKQRWPSAVTTHLWPYALRMANDIANSAPSLKNNHVSPIELFSQSDISPRVKFTHTFGSPVYVLDSMLQAGKRVPKWQHKARVGMYLGASPRHSRKVALILSLTTGLVSPQFHCQFDDLFDTLKKSSGNVHPSSQWQVKAGFTVEPIASWLHSRASTSNDAWRVNHSELGMLQGDWQESPIGGEDQGHDQPLGELSEHGDNNQTA